MATSARAEKVVWTYWDDIFNKGKYELIDGLFSPKYVYHGGGGLEIAGLDGLRQFMDGWKTAFPDARLTPDVIVDGGNMIAVRTTFTGTHKGDFGKLRPTGKKVKAAAMEVLRLSRGKIVEEWELADELSAMRQIGAVKL